MSNLGVDVLIGEPAKVDNIIVTKSHLERLETKDINGKLIEIPYFKKKHESRFLCRAVQAETLLPGDSVSYKLPPHLWNEESVVITATKETDSNFIAARVHDVDSNKTIRIVNESPHPVRLKKNSIIADITALREVDCNKICTEAEDKSHLKKPAIFSTSEVNKSYTDQVVIDPDNQLAKIWKERFKKTCERFSDVINPNPGRYNNHYGDVDCTIDFCTTPPPSFFF